MTLRKKTLLSITITFSSMIVIMLIISRFIFLENIKGIEENLARRNVERALSVYSYTLSDLESTAKDWAAWDDTYTFINDANRKYIESNMTDSTFITLRLNLMLYVDTTGRIVWAKTFDLDSEKEIPIPQSLQTHLSNDSPLLSRPEKERRVTGILLLPESPLLIASQPILNSDGEGPVRGTLILGRYLDPMEINRLGKLTSLSLNFYNIDNTHFPYDIGNGYSSLSPKVSILIQPIDNQHIVGYTVVKDIYGNPGLILEVEMTRAIYRESYNAIIYLALTIVIVGIMFGVLAVLVAEKQELLRLKKLTQAVENISISGNISKRVLIPGKDEISSLANNINNMLAVLKKSQDELKEKTKQLHIAVLEAQRANQAKSEFLSNVSHELRTPLTVIVGFTQLLQKEYYGELNEKQLEYVQDILNSSQYLLSLINDILDLAKIEAGKSRLNLEEARVEELVGSSLFLVKEQVGRSEIYIQLKIQEEVMNRKITVDKRRFKQIMVNLLSNAIKFTPQGGKVTVEAEVRRGELLVSVTDTGIGISREDQEKIFSPFYQVQAKTAGKISGSGLGLSLSKRLVTQHNGRIWVESEGIGKGSCFSFTISLGLSNQEFDQVVEM